jgi:hypothetical protein
VARSDDDSVSLLEHSRAADAPVVTHAKIGVKLQP